MKKLYFLSRKFSKIFFQMFLERFRYLATMHIYRSCRASVPVALAMCWDLVLLCCVFRSIKWFKKSNWLILLITQNLKKLDFWVENFQMFFFQMFSEILIYLSFMHIYRSFRGMMRIILAHCRSYIPFCCVLRSIKSF